MKRFLTIVAATAVAAAVTIPAVADSGPPADELATFSSCLRTHGIPIPADLEGVAVKEWIGEHEDLAGLKAAFEACDPNPSQGRRDDAEEPEELRACLRSKNLDPPASLEALKPWVLEQSATDAGKAALTACGFGGVEEKRAIAGGACGADKARASRKAEASRAREPKAQTTPST